MNVFDLLGYNSTRQYSTVSKTNVGKFALIKTSTPPPSSKIYYGSTNIPHIYYGSTPVTSVYYGSIKVFG